MLRGDEMLPSYLSLLIENRRLRRRFEELARQSVILPNASTLPPSAYSARGYFTFFLQTVKRRFIYRAWRTVRGIFRPPLFVMRVIRVLWLAVGFLQVSAVALLFSALFLVLLPALLLVALFLLLAGAGAVRRAVRLLVAEGAGGRYLFVFVGEKISPAYLALATEFCGTVLFVCESPRRASGGKMRFPTACFPTDGGYLITQRCYFRLCRALRAGEIYGRVF